MNKEYIAKYKDQLEIKRYAQSTVKTYVSQIKIFLFCVNIDARLVSVYAVLYAPTTERRRAQRGRGAKRRRRQEITFSQLIMTEQLLLQPLNL